MLQLHWTFRKVFSKYKTKPYKPYIMTLKGKYSENTVITMRRVSACTSVKVEQGELNWIMWCTYIVQDTRLNYNIGHAIRKCWKYIFPKNVALKYSINMCQCQTDLAIKIQWKIEIQWIFHLFCYALWYTPSHIPPYLMAIFGNPELNYYTRYLPN